MRDRACAVVDGQLSRGTVQRPLRILSLASAYPNPLQPTVGVFVERRLRALARIAEVQVVSPVAVLRYGSPAGSRLALGVDNCPREAQDGGIRVMYPGVGSIRRFPAD